jgi:16S rRNA (guanine527-N7)-methyltransferase
MHPLYEALSRTLSDFQIEPIPSQIGQLISFVEHLCRWNGKMNLTGLTNEEEIIDFLIADAIFLHSVIPAGKSILDLGSGSGALAVPLAIMDHERRIWSVDKVLKKIQFQRHMKRVLSISNLDPIHSRIEDIPPAGCDILTAKAFGSVSLILKLGKRHLKDNGSVFLVRGPHEESAPEDGFRLDRTQFYRLEKAQKTYQLIVYKKV